MTTSAKILEEGQYHYTPDPGTVTQDVLCGVCKKKMDVQRNVLGPRGFVMAMSGSKSLHDSYTCPNSNAKWHQQVVCLYREAKETNSRKLEDLIREEIAEILITKQHTKEPRLYF